MAKKLVEHNPSISDVEVQKYTRTLQVDLKQLQEKFPNLTIQEVELLNKPAEALNALFLNRPELIPVFDAVINRAIKNKKARFETANGSSGDFTYGWYEFSDLNFAIQDLMEEANRLSDNDLILIRYLTFVKDVYSRIVNPYADLDRHFFQDIRTKLAVLSLYDSSNIPSGIKELRQSTSIFKKSTNYAKLYETFVTQLGNTIPDSVLSYFLEYLDIYQKTARKLITKEQNHHMLERTVVDMRKNIAALNEKLVRNMATLESISRDKDLLTDELASLEERLVDEITRMREKGKDLNEVRQNRSS